MSDSRGTGTRWWYLLLLIPIVGLLATPIYAKPDPELSGFPFFYWYQFAWIPVSVAITWFVYARTRTRRLPPDERGPEGYDVPFERGPRTGTGVTATRTEGPR